MLKLIAKLLWWPSKVLDAEINIEGLNVESVERESDGNTCVFYRDSTGKPVTNRFLCTPEKHQDIVNRFRAKIKSTSQIVGT